MLLCFLKEQSVQSAMRSYCRTSCSAAASQGGLCGVELQIYLIPLSSGCQQQSDSGLLCSWQKQWSSSHHTGLIAIEGKVRVKCLISERTLPMIMTQHFSSELLKGTLELLYQDFAKNDQKLMYFLLRKGFYTFLLCSHISRFEETYWVSVHAAIYTFISYPLGPQRMNTHDSRFSFWLQISHLASKVRQTVRFLGFFKGRPDTNTAYYLFGVDSSKIFDHVYDPHKGGS